MSIISKSSYLNGLQCLKRFYLNLHSNKFSIERDEVDSSQFAIGHDVGKYAQQLFPGGVNCWYEITKDRIKSVELTQYAIKEGKKIIYEAAFEFDGLLFFADILVKDGSKWKIYEVKSSTSVKEYYLDDVSFQYYIASKSIDVKDMFVVYLNNEYVKKGTIDIKKLFAIESVIQKVKKLQENVKNKTDLLKKVSKLKIVPTVNIGEQCSNPYDCDFIGYCWKHIPEYSVFDIQNMRGKQFDLYNKGIVNLKDIPSDYKLNDKQWREVKCYLNNKDYIDKAAIKDFLKCITYPLYFLDFETISFPIPEFDFSKPYQQIPFQFSLYYKESKRSKPKSFSFLADPFCDPRKRFVENLITSTKNPGSIIVYNAGFETARINELSRDFPEYQKKLNSINDRIIDLMVPFRQKLYYKPSMQSCFSMKAVLPAIASQYSYDNLNIQEGGQASSEFLRMRSLKDKKEIDVIRKNLIDYCNRDTYGMVIILEELEKKHK